MASKSQLLATLLVLAVASATAQPNTAEFKCPKEGRFPDPADCTSFNTCLLGEGGEYVSSKGSCEGYPFDPKSQICLSPDKVPGCPVRDSSLLETDHHYDDLCEEDNFVCADCKTLIRCVDGKGFTDSTCSKDFTCQRPTSFNGHSTCYSTAASNGPDCKCSGTDKFNVDPWDKSAFLFCPTVNSDPMVHYCPGDMTFDFDLLDCVKGGEFPTCTAVGAFANPNNCTQYYSCIPTSSGMRQRTLTCDSGLMFNEATKECSDPCSWPKPTFACKAEGRFPDPDKCENFILCIPDTVPGKFLQLPGKCPPNYIWDPKAARGGHCASVDASSTTKCTPVTNKCFNVDICDKSPNSGGGATSRSRQLPFPDASDDKIGKVLIKNTI